MCKCLSVFLLSLLVAVLFNDTAFAATEITAVQAKDIALTKTGGGTVTECRLGRENGRKVYGIEIINGNSKYEMDVCVTDLRIYDYDVTTYPNHNKTGATEISEDKAKKIALAKTGGGTVTECKLDFEQGRKVYEIGILNGNTTYEMDVCVTDSQVYNFEQRTAPTKGTPDSGSGSEISAKKAQQIAIAKAGGGTVVKCKIDYEHGRKVYEIEIIDGDTKYEMDVCVTDSQIYDYKKKTVSNAENTQPVDNITGNFGITAEKAKQIALAKVGGGTVTKCKLDYEDGIQIYEIEIRYNNWEYEIEVDVVTGKIVKYEIDD